LAMKSLLLLSSISDDSIGKRSIVYHPLIILPELNAAENNQTFIAYSITFHYNYTKYSVTCKLLQLSRFVNPSTGYTIEDKHVGRLFYEKNYFI